MTDIVLSQAAELWEDFYVQAVSAEPHSRTTLQVRTGASTRGVG